MEFINAGLIGFAALAALPVIIHLLHRPRPRTQPFPSLIFLQRCTRRSRALSTLRNIVLMILRAAAVAGLALAVARPRIAGAAQVGQEGVALALVLDDAFRMGYRDGGLSRFDEARDRALDVLGTLPSGTPCALILSSGEASPLLPDPAPVRAELIRARVTDRATPLLPALVDASRILEDAPGRHREVHVFTDLARIAWTTGATADALKGLAGATVYVHDVGRERPSNVAVTRIDVAPRAPQAGRPIELAATVAAWGMSGPVTLALERSDGQRQERVISVADGASVIARFQFTPPPGPAAHGVVRLVSPDALAADNAREFAAPLNSPLKLLVLEPPDQPPYVSFALSPPSLAQRRPTEIASANSIAAAPACDAIFLTDPALLGREDVHRLAGFVQQGGSLVAFGAADAPAQESAVAAGLFPASAGEEALPEPVRLSPGTADHPALTGFARGRNGDLSAPEFTRRLRVQPDGRWKAVLQFLDRAPAALEARLGRGQIVFFAFPLVGGNDLPKHPCFVPLLHEFARCLSRAAGAERDTLVGMPVVLELRRRLADPAYALLDLATGGRESRRAEPGARLLPVAHALPPGRYAVELRSDEGQELRPFAVNLDPCGSDPTRLERDAVRKLLPESKVLFAYERGSAAGAVRENRTGRELKTFALLLVSAVLLVEIWLASRP